MFVQSNALNIYKLHTGGYLDRKVADSGSGGVWIEYCLMQISFIDTLYI